MDIWNVVADRKIREAMEEGAFDQLEGTGQPLNVEEDPNVDPAVRMAHRLLRNNGFAPVWVMEGKDLEADIQYLRQNRDRFSADEFDRRARELNKRIQAYNLKVPFASVQKLPVKE
jgi:hypothetical protein